MSETVHATSVAYAAPAIPSLKKTMKIRSKHRFKTEDIIRKYNGVLLSPSALIIQDKRL